MGRRRHKTSSYRHAGPTRGRHAAYVGTLHVARPGSATVETAEGTFLVARGGLREGMDGDEATVTLVCRGSGEPQVVVQGVLRRACERFVGTFEWAGPRGAVVALDERIRRDFFVLPDDKTPERLHVSEGDVVEARILTYPARREAGVVTLERRIGRPEGLDLPIERVIASNGLATHFGQAALEQAEQIHDDVAETIAAEPKRHDLRELLCVTIDPATARDFDDAVSCERREGGGWRLGVHIADVSHYVRPGSPIDLDARARTCSAYLVDRVLPMLPERLCDDLCSLVAGRDRLAMSVFADIDEGGEVVGRAAWCSTINSKARLSYDQVDAVPRAHSRPPNCRTSPRRAPEDLEELLRMLDEVARLRRHVRRERGAVDFETVEAKVELDGEGVPTGVSVRERTRATSLVEEAMLVANEVVAQMRAPMPRRCPAPSACTSGPPPTPWARRCLPCASSTCWSRARTSACAGRPVALQDVLERASGTSAEVPANSLLLRAQKRAVYLPRNDGTMRWGLRHTATSPRPSAAIPT